MCFRFVAHKKKINKNKERKLNQKLQGRLDQNTSPNSAKRTRRLNRTRKHLNDRDRPDHQRNVFDRPEIFHDFDDSTLKQKLSGNSTINKYEELRVREVPYGISRLFVFFLCFFFEVLRRSIFKQIGRNPKTIDQFNFQGSVPRKKIKELFLFRQCC